jgi:hypothetical protein
MPERSENGFATSASQPVALSRSLGIGATRKDRFMSRDVSNRPVPSAALPLWKTYGSHRDDATSCYPPPAIYPTPVPTFIWRIHPWTRSLYSFTCRDTASHLSEQARTAATAAVRGSPYSDPPRLPSPWTTQTPHSQAEKLPLRQKVHQSSLHPKQLLPLPKLSRLVARGASPPRRPTWRTTTDTSLAIRAPLLMFLLLTI